MPDLPVRNLAEVKRRKIRKGTHSCWECRRRKIRCKFATDNAIVCIGCDTRGTVCISQEFADEQPPTQDRRLVQRLGRVEDLLERLVDRVLPGVNSDHGETSNTSSSSGPAEQVPHSSDYSCPFSVPRPPVFDMLEPFQDSTTSAPTNFSSAPTPISSKYDTPVWPVKYAHLSRVLRETFPSQQDVETIALASPGTHLVLLYFSGYSGYLNGRTEPPSSVSEIPPVMSHPTVLAKRLMQLAVCIQQMQPTTPLNLETEETLSTLMRKFTTTVSDFVTPIDDLLGSVEGIETLCLLGLYHMNAGNLRKSWLAVRRALAVAQLMGLDRWPGQKPLRSVDPKSNTDTRTKAAYLWCRINSTDRYNSLLLGLPAGSNDDNFGEGLDGEAWNAPLDKLERAYTRIAGVIIKRNCKKDPAEAFAITQTIDYDLEQLAKSAEPSFWLPIIPNDSATPLEHIQTISHMLMQMTHYNLLILLHLPFMLRNPKERRWDYSRMTCVTASRDLLRSFLVFRTLLETTSSCRHTDYGALTAAMTIPLSYLHPKMRTHDEKTSRTRDEDRQLVQKVGERMQQMADKSNDKVTLESSEIIYRLLPLLDIDALDDDNTAETAIGSFPGANMAPVKLDVPYLGTISISPASLNRRYQDRPRADVDQSPSTTTSFLAANSNAPLLNLSANAGGQMDSYVGAGNTDSSNGENRLADIIQNDSEASDAHFFYPIENQGFTLAPFEWSDTFDHQNQVPEIAAEADEWTFQGFDAAFWESLLSNDVNWLSPDGQASNAQR